MKHTKYYLTFLLSSSLFIGKASAVVVFLDNSNSGTGSILDGETGPVGPVAVPEVAGLNISVTGISTGGGSSSPILNATGTSMGINATGDADTDAFEAAFSQSVTFRFDQKVSITALDFTSFSAGESFDFDGVSITNGDLSNGTTDTYDFGSPHIISANTDFTLQATAGTIGIENITLTVVPEPSTAALLGLGGIALILRRRK